jgi:hypothetical protein
MVDSKEKLASTAGEFSLWVGVLLPLVASAIYLEALYLLSEYGCKSGNFTANHIAAASTLVLSILGGLISYGNLKRVGLHWPDQQPDPATRSRFMAVLGILISALLSLLVFAQWLPTLLGVPCGK